MSGQCIPREELEKLLLAEPGDRRLRHLEDCPRCRAELAMYRSFMNGNSELADSRREEELAVRMKQVIIGRETGDETEAPKLRRRTRRLSRPLERSLLGVAAVLLVFLTVSRFQGPDSSPGIHLRGSADRQDETLILQTLAEPGGIRLTWTQFPDADSYMVEILAGDLVLIDELLVSGDHFLIIEEQKVDLWRSVSASLLWRVVAFQDGQRLSNSHPQVLPMNP